jgi:flagellar hook protein FlgE
MNAQSNKLGTVAENIQNANTTGYKRASTEFSSLILDSSTGNYNSGSVTSRVRYGISSEGPLSYTTSGSDLAISGNGFFVVSDPKGSPYLTRAGNFVVDGKSGSLVNAAGFTLMGYSLANGDITPSLNSLTGMVPVSISSLSMQASASTNGTFRGNLPYGYPAPEVKVGNATLPTASAAGYVTMNPQNLSNHDSISFTIDGSPATTHTLEITTQTSVDDIVSAINTNPAYSADVTASKDPDGKLRLTSVDTSTAISASYTDVAASKKSSLQVYDNVGNPIKLDIYMTKTSADSWDISIFNGNDPAAYPGSPLTGSVPLTFDSAGQLSGISQVTLNIPNGKPFTLDMKGMTQLAGEYNVTGTANGNAPSAVKGAEFGTDGTVFAVYEDGSRVAAYKIPLASVTSPDNLMPRAGNVYEATTTSGDYMVGFPETGGFGSITAGALEGSNVDIGSELTAMIEAQTSYTANSKVFQTGSELLDVLMSLKR